MAKKKTKTSVLNSLPTIEPGGVEIRFNFEDHDSRANAKVLMNVWEYRTALDDIYQKLRQVLKHGTPAHYKDSDIEFLEELKRIASIGMD